MFQRVPTNPANRMPPDHEKQLPVEAIFRRQPPPVHTASPLSQNVEQVSHLGVHCFGRIHRVGDFAPQQLPIPLP